MAKQIVFCSDGTWDGVGDAPDATHSNVLKLFNLLAGELTLGTAADPQQERTAASPEGTLQVARYLHGVGDSSNWLDRVLGGALGTGLVARVLRGYTFVSRYYTVGDGIACVGFSRGAYTARALADFIVTMGLLDWDGLGLSPDTADTKGYRFAAAAWYRYQQQRRQTQRNAHWLAQLEEFMAQAPELAASIALKPRYVTGVRIAAVGVWDTVGSLGIPKLSADHDTRLDLLRFVNTGLNPLISNGFHAVAADEQRVDFTPTLWDPDPARIVQCFFPGAHGDVGGGYPEGAESQLADISLAWMSERLKSCGVLFRESPQVAVSAEQGPMHLPWTAAPYTLRPIALREFPRFQSGKPDFSVHPSLGQRIGKDIVTIAAAPDRTKRTVAYLPLALASAGYLDLSSIPTKQ